MTTRPDLARLRAIGAEIQALQDAGQWNVSEALEPGEGGRAWSR